jgi:hypothetical protein
VYLLGFAEVLTISFTGSEQGKPTAEEKTSFCSTTDW